MIKILDEKKPKKASKPYYVLVYNYMIGDGDGHTNEEVELSVDNPYIERYVTLLNSLKPLKGSWGVGLSRGDLYKHFDEGHLTKDDYSFLNRLMFDGEDEDDEDGEYTFEVSKENEVYASEFFEGVRDEAEYSFLVFEGVDLFYYDEYKKKHNTKIVK